MNRKRNPIFQVMSLGVVLLGLTTFLRAQTAPPSEPLTPYGTALLDYKTGKYDEARAAIDVAEKTNPGDIQTEILKARILTELGDFAGGEQILRPLLTETGPLDVQLALGDLLLRKRSFDRAAKYYALALQAKPGDTWKTVHFNFGARPKPAPEGRDVLAHNGVSAGKGHLTGGSEQPKPETLAVK